MLGKIGIAASGAKAGRVYAIVEHENGALFRSDNYGDSWTRGSEDRDLRTRAWYYHHIYADPQDADVVWVLNVDAWRRSTAARASASSRCTTGTPTRCGSTRATRNGSSWGTTAGPR